MGTCEDQARGVCELCGLCGLDQVIATAAE
jgi:hypothetical protein